MTKITEAARKFGASRETSPEVAQAILDLAELNQLDCERVWATPSRSEEATVHRWAFLMTDEDTLFWGGTIVRHAPTDYRRA